MGSHWEKLEATQYKHLIDIGDIAGGSRDRDVTKVHGSTEVLGLTPQIRWAASS
jgi:hypothetical protein